MSDKTFFLKMDDSVEVFVRQWARVENPQGVLQIAHGMAEHSGRYARFASYLNGLGFVVVASDHRGHGQTAEKAGLMGYFAKEDGFDRVVDDLYTITRWIQGQFPKRPVILMGHSMGSFLARRYLQKYGRTLAGAILMGSSGDPGVAGKLGRQIALWQMREDPTLPSTILDRLAFGSFNKGIKSPQTKFDWLSRDPKEVQKYLDDPHCGMVCSSGLFHDLFTGLAKIHDPGQLTSIPKDLPLYVVSGGADPVGKNGSGVRRFVNQLKKQGITNIETKLYPEARHELLNETNREEVMQDLGRWLADRIVF